MESKINDDNDCHHCDSAHFLHQFLTPHRFKTFYLFGHKWKFLFHYFNSCGISMFLLLSDIKKFHAIGIVEKYDGNYM